MYRRLEVGAFASVALLCVGVGGSARADEPQDRSPENGAIATPDQLDELLEVNQQGGPAREHLFRTEDLAPYFASGNLQEAKKLFDKHRYAKARALLAKEKDSPPARYLAALSAYNARDYTTAQAELLELAQVYPALSDLCLLYAGLAAESRHDLKGAVSALEAVQPGAHVFPTARFALSRVLKKRLELERAVEVLNPLRELPPSRRNDPIRASALTAIALLEQTRGNWPGEHRALLDVWATNPRSAQAARAWERLRQLPVPNKWRVRRAESFLAANDNAEAMRLAKQVKEPLPEEAACRASFVIGNALRKDRRHRLAIETLTPVIARCQLPDVRPQAMFVMGYSQSVVDRPAAIRTYDALARDYPTHAYADDALFFAGEVAFRAGDEAGALDRLEQVASRFPNGNFAAEALFHIGWIHRRQGRAPAALSAFERLEHLPGASNDDVLRARYWKARVLAAQGDASAQALLASIAQSHPVSWYGLLARQRSGAAGAEPAQVAREDGADDLFPLDAGALGEDRRFLAAVELLRMELPAAREALAAIDVRTVAPSAAQLVIEMARRAGADRTATAMTRAAFGTRLAGTVAERSRTAWEATFPRPFRRIVERHAAASRIDPDLLQALMREESRFNPYARSSTGALGLTQLMPLTAAQVAKSIKLASFTVDALYQPAVNIRLGARYLGSLRSDFGGNAVYAVAAYNAGPGAVSLWLRNNATAELDEWVEEIPITETRDYVKRVLGSYGAYQLVYGGQVPRLDLLAGASAALGSARN